MSAHLEVAARAELGSVLPGLLLASYLEYSGQPPMQKTFHQSSTLHGSSALELTLAEGDTVSDQDAFNYMAMLASTKGPATTASSVRNATQLYD